MNQKPVTRYGVPVTIPPPHRARVPSQGLSPLLFLHTYGQIKAPAESGLKNPPAPRANSAPAVPRSSPPTCGAIPLSRRPRVPHVHPQTPAPASVPPRVYRRTPQSRMVGATSAMAYPRPRNRNRNGHPAPPHASSSPLPLVISPARSSDADPSGTSAPQ